MIHKSTVTRAVRGSSLVIGAIVLALALLVGAGPGLAITMTWTNGDDVWTSTTAWQTNVTLATSSDGVTTNFCSVVPTGFTVITNCSGTVGGGTGGFPSSGDNANFTNNISSTVTISGSIVNLSVLTVSNTAGIVTIDAGLNTLTVTGRVRIADGGATSTVVWAGGILSAPRNGGVPALQIAPNANSVGNLFVTNGSVIAGGSISVGGSPLTARGKIVVSGSGLFTNQVGDIPNNNFNFRLRSQSQLIITNGGRFFWPDLLRAQSNSLVLVSDAGSSLVCTGVGTSTLTIGDLEGPGCTLIVSNGAKAVSNNGTISIGRNNGSSNTGIVCGAGSQLISRTVGTGAGITIGVGSAAHRDNDLIVYDGGYIFTDGAFFNISGTGTNCSFHMGGTGAMSTGFAVTVRANSQAVSPLMVVTNAVFSCSVLGLQGASNNVLNVLSGGTLIFSNQYAVSATTTNVLNGNGRITIDGGTIIAVSGTNALGVNIGVNTGVPGSTLTITNGGKLLSELGTIGAGSSFNTGIVAGVGSVWSNSASLTVGDSSGINNTLAINGGAVFTGNFRVRPTNTIVFTAGTLSAGSTRIDPGANGSNVFVVGNGISAAYYDMAAGDTGFHFFGSPGLVVTNGASLRGSGTLTGATILGTFVPGFAGTVGSVFSSNSLLFGSSTVLNYDLGTSSDSVIVQGSLALGHSTLNVTDSGGFGAGSYVLFTHTNTVSAPSGTITVGTLPPGFTAIVSNDLSNSQVLLLVSTVGGGDSYGAWVTSYGLTGANAAGTADPDGDGMNNTNEFLTGFNPTNGSAYAHVINETKSANDIVVTYLGANGDSSGSPGPKTNILEYTPGTANGSYSNDFASTGQTNVLSGGNGSGVVTNMVDSGGATNIPSRYYRVRVLAP